ncbi:MAG: cell division protein FtsH [Deltaproteobacteria bacterium RIFCSPLOWO2_02_FULL_44_10]|nr:MAG: cell division protein FtsH [Deltaproteobacteria bacterium RIFCSPHIGHO2_02_FULL_44_16]OGQ46603.1 MAG: cell division protein FtsH [Deltaproteobacteria bacterium RIFCSPLOWO2_02_FULL_44_10]
MVARPRKSENNSNRHKTIALWLVIALMVLSLLHFMNQPMVNAEKIDFSVFLQALEQNQVESVTVQEDEYRGKFKSEHKNGAFFETIGPVNSERALEKLEQSDASVQYRRKRETPFWQQLLISWLPMLLLFAFFFFSMRQIQIGGGKAMSFGRSKAKLLKETQKRITFKDVAGVEEAKQELEEIIEFLKEPKKFTKLGGRIPKGVLLMGPPGTGKTLLARAVAGEARVPFFSISGSDFVEMFVGVGASRVRDLFEQGKKNAPCIIFIDEIDAVGRHRGAGIGGGHDEREQTLNQLLVEMDGFESNEGVIIMAATNRPDVLDPALLRAGRFDRRVVVPRPDLKGREEILQVHAQNKPLDKEVDLSTIARGTPGFSGADLENVVNEAALYAARHNRSVILMGDFEIAKDKVLMGSERKSMMISEEERKNTAYHEAGHTLVAKLIPGTDPIHKVTIIPRGMALGLTQQLPENERYTQNKSYCENMIAILMGGRAAEEIVFDQPTSGAGNDIERATDLARKMVCEWGMSEKLGPLSFGKKEEQIFLGREIAQHSDFSENTAEHIDTEISRIVQMNYQRAKDLIQTHREKLNALAEALLEHESLDGAQITKLLQGKKLNIKKEEVPPNKSEEPALNLA